MTYQPDADKTELRCPLGFTVQPARSVPQTCGHDRCLPETCERLRRYGIEISCPHWETCK